MASDGLKRSLHTGCWRGCVSCLRAAGQVEHVLATSTLPQKKSQNMLVQMDGVLAPMVTSKDVVLHVCGVSDHSNRRFSAGRNRRWGGGGLIRGGGGCR
jgi:homoaconitase/3-isopropylmalate dehydratase large subunit